MTKIRLYSASVAVLALASLAAPAAAQTVPADQVPTDTPQSGQPQAGAGQTDTAAASTGEPGDIVVTGIRASIRKSIDAKRQSTVIADVLSAEDIGKFPDKNVAEALQRVPGVVINRTFGEGERVSVRGTNVNLTKTLLNGHNVATADWFIEDQLAATRSFNYLTLPAEIVGQLDVYKSPQADVEEGGIGATINVHTRNPLDLARWTVSGSAQAVYSEKSDKFDPQASALVSWKNDAETFGILVGGVYQKRRLRRDGAEVLGYVDGVVNGQAVQVPNLIGSALFKQDRERFGGNIGVQFRPSESLEVNLTGLYSRFNADNFNQNFMAWTSNALGNGGTLTNAAVNANGTVTSGTVTSVPGGRAVVFDAIAREAYAQVWSGDADVLWSPAEGTKLHLKGGYTKAVGNTSSQPFYEGGAPGSFTFDITGRVPQVRYGGGIDPTNPASLAFDFASLNRITNSDNETYAYVDLDQDLHFGAISGLRVGGKFTDHNRRTGFFGTTYGNFFVPLSSSGCGGRACTSADFAGGLTPDDYLDGSALPGTLTSYFQIDQGKLKDILNALPAAARARIINPPENYAIKERTYGGYAMLKLGGTDEQYSGNVGVRVIRTEQRSTGNQVGTGGAGSIDNAFGSYTPITVERAYTDILPSFNLRIPLTDQVTFRFGAGRTVTRPDYTDIVPRVSLNPGALTGDGGDPYVNPFRANQLDMSLEWYPDRETIVAVAGFYKQLKSFIVNTTDREVFPVQTTTPTLSRCTVIPGGDNLYNCAFDINRRSNGAGGTIKGVEVQLQRPLFAGFGVQANYTYADAQADDGTQVPGSSKHAANLVGYFENDWLSARVAYTYRSKFFINIDRAVALNQRATESLDASINLKLTDNVTLTADAVNLTNEKIRLYSGTTDRFRAFYDNGRIFYLGARFKY
ncbi:iron complex outermembrane recepter protein [Sphingomonas gellani]|uniref:Iron complex outermembrane recepter protein n=1 Tax=Sphingomonas gellani TaxID=1166340 RepID=A0A1H8IVR8_9SPHN|nr:TonB-dependent receptor [Sphingomonas gellani]SEN72047.1 iron complex outermembrane recepter protein [Sphingomonas gellani]